MNPVLLEALREARRRPSRPALALLGVVLGVAALVAIVISTRGAREAYRRVYATLAGTAALEVVADGTGGVSPALAGALEELAGVRAVLPIVQGSAALVAPGPRTPMFVLGVVPGADEVLRPLALEAGAGLSEADGVLLPAAFARERGLTVGGFVRLVTLRGPVDLPVVGLLRPGALGAAGGVSLLLPLTLAQRLFGEVGRASALQVALADGADPDEVAGRIAARLPKGLRVARPWARGQLAEGTLLAVDAGLSAVSLMALVAAVFVIGNAFALGLVERRRTLAVLRGLGATRRQVTLGLLGEALLLGLLGTLGGVALGVPAARGVALGLERTLGTTLPAFDVGWVPLALGLLVGPATTLAAAVGPVRRALRRDVLHDLEGLPDLVAEGPLRVTPWLGAGLLLCALGVVAGLVDGWLPSALIAPGVAAAMLGAALLYPALLPALRGLLGGRVGAWAGPAAWLGLQQVARRPAHATLTATVLFVAVLGGVGMGSEILSTVGDVRGWSERALYEDFFVRATMPEAGTMLAAPVPLALSDEIARLPGTEHVNRIRFLPARLEDEPILVIARSFEPGRAPALPVRDVLGGGTLGPLSVGETVVGTALAERLGLKPGDRVRLATAQGPRPLTVVATVVEYTAGGQVAYLSWEGAEAALGAGAPHALMVVARPGARDGLGRALEALCAREGLLLQSNAELQGAVDGMVGGVVGLLWAALLLVFAVAAVGVANTLTTTVVEQTRALGMLRAVGMTRAQVGRSVGAQALGLSLLGALPGAAAGLGLGGLLQIAVRPIRGYSIPFQVHPGLLAGCVLTAVAVALLAALLPGRRAARLPVPEALRYE